MQKRGYMDNTEAKTEPNDILLPTTTEELDALIADVVEKFKVPATDDTAEMIATMIMHMPSGRAYAPLAYFGNGVLQSMAKKIAWEKLDEFSRKRNAATAESVAKLADTQKQGVSDAESLSNA